MFTLELSTLSTRSRHSGPDQTDRQANRWSYHTRGSWSTPPVCALGHTLLSWLCPCLPLSGSHTPTAPPPPPQTSNLSYPCPSRHVGMWLEVEIDMRLLGLVFLSYCSFILSYLQFSIYVSLSFSYFTLTSPVFLKLVKLFKLGEI